MSPGLRRPPLAKSWQTVLGEATQPPSLGNNQFQTMRAASVPSSTAKLALMGANGGSGDLAGTSTGAKVGIAFGVFSGVLAVGLLIFLFSRHRRQAGERQKLQDGGEKLHEAPAPAASPYEPTSRRSDPRAPRINLRPVTQFFPNWSGFDRRASRGAAMSLAPASAAGGSPWDRPSPSQSSYATSYAANPFGSQAERLPSPIAEERSARSSPSASFASFRDKMRAPSSASAQDALTANGPVLATAAAASGAAGAAASLSRKTSMRKDGPKNVDLTLPKHFGVTPPSPAETEYSMTSVAPGSALPASNGAATIAVAGGPQNFGVHRVQLDFKPTLDDEMELRAGQLIRLLYEYDDGWVFAIRVDRSQQGVVPRTCLSTRPVKPRLQRPGPPVNPTGQARGPNHANGQRPMPQGMRGPGLPESPKVAPSPRPASPASHVGLPESDEPVSSGSKPKQYGPTCEPCRAQPDKADAVTPPGTAARSSGCTAPRGQEAGAWPGFSTTPRLMI